MIEEFLAIFVKIIYRGLQMKAKGQD
jgi:hypothetical protein